MSDFVKFVLSCIYFAGFFAFLGFYIGQGYTNDELRDEHSILLEENTNSYEKRIARDDEWHKMVIEITESRNKFKLQDLERDYSNKVRKLTEANDALKLECKPDEKR